VVRVCGKASPVEEEARWVEMVASKVQLRAANAILSVRIPYSSLVLIKESQLVE
jgi:arginyl-tRNA--protein-N-Asp/Glu arginylyltransferase